MPFQAIKLMDLKLFENGYIEKINSGSPIQLPQKQSKRDIRHQIISGVGNQQIMDCVMI